MVAAESFCGMEQTTPRVKPVEVLNWNPGCGLEPISTSHDDKGVQWNESMEAL